MNIAPQIKDTTEAISSLPSLVDALAHALQTPLVAILLILFFTIWVVVNKDFSHLFEIFGRKEKRRFEQLNEYVSNPKLADTETLAVISDVRDAYYFKVATGIYAEKQLRSSLIKLHETSHRVTWRRIKRAFDYIVISPDGSIEIRELSRFEKVSFAFNLFSGFFGVFGTITLFILFMLSEKTLNTTLVSIGSITITLLVTVVSFHQVTPEYAADIIKEDIKK